MSSAIRSLILTAQQHGVELNFDRMMHECALKENQEPDSRVLCRIAARNNLKAKEISASWQELRNLDTAYPVIAQLKNKRYIVIVGFNQDGRDESISVIDPSSHNAKLLKVTKEKFTKAWSSRLILVRSHYQIKDEAQPFSLRWIIREFYTQKLLFVQTISIALLLHIFAVIPIIYIMIVLDKVVTFEAYSTLFVVSVGVVIAHLLGGILGYMKQYISLFFVSKLEARINMKTFDSLMSQPLGYFFSNTSDSLVKTVQQVSALRHFIVSKIFGTLLDATALLIYVPILILFSPALFVVVLLFALLIAFNNLWSTKRQKDLITTVNQYDSLKQSTLSNAVSGIETVKTLALESSLKQDWEKYSISHTLANLEEGKKSALSAQVSSTLQQLMTVAVIVIGVLMVFEGNLSAGVLIGVHMLASKITGPLVQLVSMSADFSKFSTAINLLANVINEKGENKRGGISPQIEGGIEFRDVTFGYNEDKKLINKLSFSVKPKQKVGLVGPSGSGRSTILRLAQGLVQADTGTVFIDDHDIRVIDKEHLRTNVSMIGGHHAFFADTIRANILLTMPTASRERLHWALRMSGLLDDLAHLPEGMETQVEEGGTNLPKSMLPKIALARSLIRNPRVLLMYDVLTGLSLDDEISILKNMEEISKDRTVIFVSHHISQMIDCDHILVMGDNGQLVEQGTHQELIRQKGWYSEHWKKEQQLRGLSTNSNSTNTNSTYTNSTNTNNSAINTISESTQSTKNLQHPSNQHALDNNKGNADSINGNSHNNSYHQTRSNLANSVNSNQVTQTSADRTGASTQTKRSANQPHTSEKNDKHLPASKEQTSENEVTPHVDSLKLKELGERLQKNNQQAQKARLEADKKLEEVKRSHQLEQKVVESSNISIPANKTVPIEQSTLAAKPTPEKSIANKPTKESKLTKQEESLTSFIEGYLKND